MALASTLPNPKHSLCPTGAGAVKINAHQVEWTNDIGRFPIELMPGGVSRTLPEYIFCENHITGISKSFKYVRYFASPELDGDIWLYMTESELKPDESKLPLILLIIMTKTP